MPADNTLGLLLDGPMQSWGCGSRFDRRTTLLYPTRSAIIGMIAAAAGIDKFAPDETERLKPFERLAVTVVCLPRRDRRGRPLLVRRMEDYHTVSGIRRAHGKIEQDATVQTYRHYLLDARFGVFLQGPDKILTGIAEALRNPRWGVWLGRKSCIPASPVLLPGPKPRAEVWKLLLKLCGYTGKETEEAFDRIVEVGPKDSSAEITQDAPAGFGQPIGQRHKPRWVRRIPATLPE